MNAIALSVATLGLLLVGGAVAASNPAAVEHAAEQAHEMASSHALFHRTSSAGPADASDEDHRCAEFGNHGEFVSGVAHDDANDSDNETDDRHGDVVREAARSDVGKCHEANEARGDHDDDETDDDETDDDNETADGNETDEENETAEHGPPDREDGDRGRSAEARADHEPQKPSDDEDDD